MAGVRLGVSLFGLALFPEYRGDDVLALMAGITFQYFAIAPTRRTGIGKGALQAAEADFLSLTSFGVGLFGRMALTQFVFFHGHIRLDHAVSWSLMQVGMIIGYFNARPPACG